MALSNEESLSNEETEKYFNECMTGGEAYKALEHMLWRWYRQTNDITYMTLITQLIRPYSQEDWALSIKEMLEGRKNGMRSSIWENEKVPMSICNCKNK